jgi:hypothetical protein
MESRRPMANESAGPRARGRLDLLLALALSAVLLALSAWGLKPPAPLGLDAPAREFSAARAAAVLRRLAGPERPHPPGSPEHPAVRQRVVDALSRLGLAAKVESGLACNPRGGCGQIENVVARLPGREAGPAVLLSAHYDSVPAGPGVADDLSGVASAIETARAILAGPPPRHTVLLLLDDGEELGLLGARSFVADSPEASEVGAVVNLEARGTSGPSLLFETSGASAWAVPLFAAAARHPVASSVFATLYDYVPNDTDLHVFKLRDLPGLNFAFIGNPAQYHTRLDDLAHLSLSSLQHQGENALAAVRALAESTPPRVKSRAEGGREVYFDLLGRVMVRWPASAGLRWLERLLLVAVLGLAAALLLGRGGMPGGDFAWGLSALPFGALAAALIGAVLRYGVLARAFPAAWVAHPLPACVAVWAAALATSIGVAALLAPRAGARGLWAGIWIGWAALGLGISGLAAPGIGYLFLLPAAVAALAAPLVWTETPASPDWRRTLGALAPAMVAALLWFPVVLPLHDGLGREAILLVTLLLAILWLTLAPLVATAARGLCRGVILAALLVACLGSVGALLSPPFSRDCPPPSPTSGPPDPAAGFVSR